MIVNMELVLLALRFR